ncbi:lectin C-type domain containing protein [Elysia marginata]|uniref:Lectin C-type domain containing protein n=1 Tax=Elysia marginata TaxID=1093978 RepID=A0AAV4GKQ4_9GAST|nr:lectin C-type domain containing protein [Elysia marginata]
MVTTGTAALQWSNSGDVISASNWAWGEPGNRQLTTDDAVVMNGPEGWTWKLVSRSSAAQLVCQRDLSQECLGLFFQGKCLVFHEELKTWTAARDDCASNGSYLVEPKTELLDRAMDQYLLQVTGAAVVLLGGQDLARSGMFFWDHSRENLTHAYTDWSTEEPNNYAGIEDVLQWTRGSQTWNDIPSGLTSPYVCQKGEFSAVGPQIKALLKPTNLKYLD